MPQPRPWDGTTRRESPRMRQSEMVILGPPLWMCQGNLLRLPYAPPPLARTPIRGAGPPPRPEQSRNAGNGGGGDQLRTISGESVARAKSDLSLAESDAYARDTLLRLRQNLGTDLVLTGSYADLGSESGGQLRVDFRIQDALTGETIASVAEVGTDRLSRRMNAYALSKSPRLGGNLFCVPAWESVFPEGGSHEVGAECAVTGASDTHNH